MSVYRPRAALVIFTPPYTFAGVTSESVMRLTVPVRRATLIRNDHNHADELMVETSWKDSSVDPRFLKSATCEFYMGQADDDGTFETSRKTLRFVGVLVRAERNGDDASVSVSLEFHDYTSFFLQQRAFAARGAPTFSDTLQDAWRKICANVGPRETADGETIVSTVEALADRLEFRGEIASSMKDVVLGKAVSSRMASFGTFPTRPGADAWAVWLQCVGSLGLLSYIDLDKCIVTSATDHYANEDSPFFVWGQNVLGFNENAKPGGTHARGICLVSLDPLTGTVLEAFWPPRGTAGKTPKLGAARIGGRPPKVSALEYDRLDHPGITDEKILEFAARNAWEERSRGELEGHIKTAEMVARSPNGEVDLLDLRAGDGVNVRIDPEVKFGLLRMSSFFDRVRYLRDRGYSEQIAELVARNAEALPRLTAVRHVTRVEVELETDEDAGTFCITVDFQNRLNVSAGDPADDYAEPEAP